MSQRILIVDDSPSDLKTLAAVLRDDYAVSLATSGAEALDLARSQAPDLVLLDILMPEMDGFAVLDALKNDPATAVIPVIFITVVEAVTEKVRGLEAGAVDYITKPFEPLEVRARVGAHLALRRAQKRLEEQNRLLAEAMKIREEVEAMARHDIKNPLHAILGATDLLPLHGPLNPAQHEDLAMIQRGALTILDIVNRYFDLFRIEHGLYELTPETVDLVAVCRRVLRDLAILFRGKDLHPKLTWHGEPLADDATARLVVNGEETLCYAMLANLVKNAMEAAPAGSELAIDLADEPPSIRITNPGEVAEAIRDRFFDKYVTGDRDAGTGLGTYSARRIAELLGGDIVLNCSTPGFTTVEIHLHGCRLQGG